LREGFPLSDSPISSPSKDGGGVPRAAPNGGGGDSVWVRYDTPEWDRVERFGHRAVGKVFIRYGRVEGSWILKSDLRALDTLAVADGGGQGPGTSRIGGAPGGMGGQLSISDTRMTCLMPLSAGCGQLSAIGNSA